jgi:cell division septation protein DedD
MADDNTRRSFRSNEPYRREPESLRMDDAGGDPLAELARLIGRNDPFAELGRSQPRQGSQQAPQQEPQHAGRDDWDRAPAREPNFGRDDFAPNSYQDTRHESYQGSHRESFQGSRRASSRQADHEADQGYDPRYGSPQDYAPPYGEGGRRDAYEDDRFEQDKYSYQEGGPDGRGYDEPHDGRDDGHQHGRRYDDGQDDDRRDGQETDDYYEEDDAPLAPHEDEMYDDAPRARRRGGLATALALTGCALLGTAGAYAYRSYSGPPSSLQSPPVITADSSTPTKIVPASAADTQSTKAIQDRVAAAGKEQIVPKQEEPVALSDVAPPTRGVQPSPAAPVSGGLGGVATEPRRIKTERIRPDGNDISGRPVGTLPPAATRSAPPPAPAPKAAATPPARNGGPISLDPPANDPPAAPPTRTAARTPPESASTSGGFVVQLSSQKSENDAQASFRTLQAKFPNELGGRQAIIRRADLGSKGVVYRAMVGPFASSQEASQFCNSYKAAGGQCFLPKE